MRNEDIYRDWIETRKHMENHPSLVENVMREIRRAEPTDAEDVSVLIRLIEWVDASRWMKAAVIGAAGAVGIGRVVFGIHLLLAFRFLGV